MDTVFALVLQYYILHGNTIVGKHRTLSALTYLTAKCANIDYPLGKSLTEVKVQTQNILDGEIECQKNPS